MSPYDQPELHAMIDKLADVFPVSANRIDAAKRNYFDYLADISIERMRKVVVMAIQQLDVFPSIHRLRELAGVTNADRCQACAGNGRESHVKAVTIDLFEECNRDIGATIEAVHGHCGRLQDDDPDIRLWAKQAIAEHMGWSTLPVRFQSPEQRQLVRDQLRAVQHPDRSEAAGAIRTLRRILEQTKTASKG